MDKDIIPLKSESSKCINVASDSTTAITKEFINLYENMHKLKIENAILESRDISEKKGRELYVNYPEFRDIAHVMEHPEFYKFYYKYMRDWKKFKK